MGYLTITRISGDPERLIAGYRESAGAMDQVGRDHGLILHAAAPAEDGILVVNLWPSREESEAAARDERRLAQVDRHSLAPSDFSREHHELERYELFADAGK